ncbi:MAG: hypothetical protein QGG73_09375 [Candidatus Hydrogenedentes bacterium]|nr:hypothetical protein [Candidatus Hydrogenedentota bacterium]
MGGKPATSNDPSAPLIAVFLTEIVHAATGKEPSPAPYLSYLEGKYSALYGL